MYPVMSSKKHTTGCYTIYWDGMHVSFMYATLPTNKHTVVSAAVLIPSPHDHNVHLAFLHQVSEGKLSATVTLLVACRAGGGAWRAGCRYSYCWSCHIVQYALTHYMGVIGGQLGQPGLLLLQSDTHINTIRQQILRCVHVWDTTPSATTTLQVCICRETSPFLLFPSLHPYFPLTPPPPVLPPSLLSVFIPSCPPCASTFVWHDTQPVEFSLS